MVEALDHHLDELVEARDPSFQLLNIGAEHLHCTGVYTALHRCIDLHWSLHCSVLCAALHCFLHWGGFPQAAPASDVPRGGEVESSPAAAGHTPVT